MINILSMTLAELAERKTALGAKRITLTPHGDGDGDDGWSCGIELSRGEVFGEGPTWPEALAAALAVPQVLAMTLAKKAATPGGAAASED